MAADISVQEAVLRSACFHSHILNAAAMGIAFASFEDNAKDEGDVGEDSTAEKSPVQPQPRRIAEILNLTPLAEEAEDTETPATASIPPEFELPLHSVPEDCGSKRLARVRGTAPAKATSRLELQDHLLHGRVCQDGSEKLGERAERLVENREAEVLRASKSDEEVVADKAEDDEGISSDEQRPWSGDAGMPGYDRKSAFWEALTPVVVRIIVLGALYQCMGRDYYESAIPTLLDPNYWRCLEVLQRCWPKPNH